MRRKKYQIKIIFLVGLLIICARPAFGIERLGYFGQSWSFPWFSDPVSTYDNITYHMDSAYFLSESWSAALSIDTQVAGMKLFMLQIGPDAYLLRNAKALPFVSARLIYNMLPDQDVGWLFNLGFETHVGKSSEVENFRLRVNSGVGQIFFSSGTTMFVDLIRIGLIWCF